MYLFASGGIEVATKHGLPQTIDSKWVFADEHSGWLVGTDGRILKVSF